MRTSSTPLSKLASMRSASTSCGSDIERENPPNARSTLDLGLKRVHLASRIPAIGHRGAALAADVESSESAPDRWARIHSKRRYARVNAIRIRFPDVDCLDLAQTPEIVGGRNPPPRPGQATPGPRLRLDSNASGGR
jgi:hypothetical protein